MTQRIGISASIRGNLYGGAVSALVAMPGNIVFGLIAFAPLGEAFAPQGILAAMYCSVFAGAAAALLGGTPAMITGPKATLAVVFAAALTQFTSLSTAPTGLTDPPAALLALAFLAVFGGGVLQVLFGLTRLGGLIKYIPYPVMAGFLNGTAILIVLSQVWALLGLERQPSLLDLSSGWTLIKPLNIAVGVFTAAVMWVSQRRVRAIPGSIVALAVGSGLYYALAAFGAGDHLGPVIGRLPSALPDTHLLTDIPKILADPLTRGCLPALTAAAFSLAILGSTESLLSATSVQNLTRRRTDANRELLGQGFGNLLAASFGGLSGAGFVVRSQVNHQAGGRTRLSGIVHGITVLLGVYLLSPLIGGLPQVVIAGVVVMIALQVIDRWSLKLMFNLAVGRAAANRELLSNCLVVVLVMLTTAFFNLMAAVALGISVSILMFLEKVSRSVVRRVASGATIHSRKQRDPESLECLRVDGRQIRLLELEGSLFFGSADLLAREIERMMEGGARYFILDVKRLNGIDSTGVRILQQIHGLLARQNCKIALAGFGTQPMLEQLFTDLDATRTFDSGCMFEDSDLALEHFEELLLADVHPEAAARRTIHLPDHPILVGLDPQDIEIVRRMTQLQHYDAGQAVFQQGDSGDGLYLVTRGNAEVSIELSKEGRRKRLQTFPAGTVFGEMALLDGSPRSATVTARTPMTCRRLDLENFESLKTEYPRIAITLITNIGRVMSSRLRTANGMISDLEQ